MQQNDFVMVSSPHDEQRDTCYFFGIVHTLKENLLIVKAVIDREQALQYPEEKERITQLVQYAQEDNPFLVTRICTLNNFNKILIAINNVPEIGFMTNLVLDPTNCENT